jgi:hypothetical protein
MKKYIVFAVITIALLAVYLRPLVAFSFDGGLAYRTSTHEKFTPLR